MNDRTAIESYERGAHHQGSPLFDPDDEHHRDPVDPLAVECPRCGAMPSRRCRINIAGRRRGEGYPTVHQARHALARHVAGVADTPTPTLLDEEG